MFLPHKKCFALIVVISIFLSCQKRIHKPAQSEEIATTANNGRGVTQISGVGFYDATDGCNATGLGASFALTMTGDLEGCHYVFIDESECSPSGTYREEGRELFVGTYNGQHGTFWTTYKFEAKYEGCSENGTPLGAEIFGRCQHPIVEGSGTGVFNGSSGQLNFKDDIEAENFPYRGHLRF